MTDFLVKTEENKYSVTVQESNYLVSVSGDTPTNQVTVVDSSENLVQIIEQPTSVTVTENRFNVSVNETASSVVVQSNGIQGPSGLNYYDILKGPQFTYDTDGRIERIDYDDGSYKTFDYVSDKLDQITFFILGGETIQKTFNYSGDTITSIDQITL